MGGKLTIVHRPAHDAFAPKAAVHCTAISQRPRRLAGQGTITPGEAAEFARVVETLVGAIEATDFDRRLRMFDGAHPAAHEGMAGRK